MTAQIPVDADITALRARVADLVEQVQIGYGETALASALNRVLDLARNGTTTGRQIRDAIRDGLED